MEIYRKMLSKDLEGAVVIHIKVLFKHIKRPIKTRKHSVKLPAIQPRFEPVTYRIVVHPNFCKYQKKYTKSVRGNQ
jgi:hypothetical protein